MHANEGNIPTSLSPMFQRALIAFASPYVRVLSCPGTDHHSATKSMRVKTNLLDANLSTGSIFDQPWDTFSSKKFSRMVTIEEELRDCEIAWDEREGKG